MHVYSRYVRTHLPGGNYILTSMCRSCAGIMYAYPQQTPRVSTQFLVCINTYLDVFSNCHTCLLTILDILVFTRYRLILSRDQVSSAVTPLHASFVLHPTAQETFPKHWTTPCQRRRVFVIGSFCWSREI
jgi:hypothetical protein